jgi:AbiU2
MPKSTSPRFQECRKLVHEDAFEAKLAAETAIPLISGLLSEMGEHRAVGIFLRRVLMRYLSLVLSRLLDESRNGRTGITASIPSLLEMTREETILSQTQLQHFDSALEKIKANAGQQGSDLPKALRDLRNIHLAHKLIPWNNTINDVSGQHLTEFAEDIFDFVVRLDKALAEATSITLADSRRGSADFQRNVDRFYQTLRNA